MSKVAPEFNNEGLEVNTNTNVSTNSIDTPPTLKKEFSSYSVDDLDYNNNSSMVFGLKITQADLEQMSELKEVFVDDDGIYKPRITRKQRMDYWKQILQQYKVKKPLTTISLSKESLVFHDNNHDDIEKEISQFSKRFVQFTKRMLSERWDHVYLNCFMIWLIIVSIIQSTYWKYSDYSELVIVLPLLIMFLSQLIPILCSIVIMIFHRKLIYALASINIWKWSFVVVLVCQYLERFYFTSFQLKTITKTMRNTKTMNDMKDKLIQPIHSFENKTSNNIIEEDKDEWMCIVCGLENKKSKSSLIESHPNLVFGSIGQYYIRNYVTIQIQKDFHPKCEKCFTSCNYQPNASTLHLFPRSKQQFNTFANYPKTPHSNLHPHLLRRCYNKIVSCLFGIRNDQESKLLFNDWRLYKYIASILEEVPRPSKSMNDFYQLGEIIECQLHKVDWTRARVIKVHENRLYDIHYTSGETLRYVDEKLLRLPSLKQKLAYRIEMCMVILILSFPILLIVSYIRKNISYIFLGSLVVSGYLLVVRIIKSIHYLYSHYKAGLFRILKLSFLFTLPILLLFILSFAILFIKNSSYISLEIICYLFIIVKLLSLILVSMIRSTYAIMLAIIFLQAIIGEYLIARQLDGYHVVDNNNIGFLLIPFFTMTLTIKYFRMILHTIWDVCLIIR